MDDIGKNKADALVERIRRERRTRCEFVPIPHNFLSLPLDLQLYYARAAEPGGGRNRPARCPAAHQQDLPGGRVRPSIQESG